MAFTDILVSAALIPPACSVNELPGTNERFVLYALLYGGFSETGPGYDDCPEAYHLRVTVVATGPLYVMESVAHVPENIKSISALSILGLKSVNTGQYAGGGGAVTVTSLYVLQVPIILSFNVILTTVSAA